jgi:hypothetical protein
MTLPRTRRWKLTNRLRFRLRGELMLQFENHQRAPKFGVYLSHSRWVWWKFYRDDK